MAAERRRDIDWVVIKYKDVLTILALVLIIGGGLGGGYIYWRHNSNPQVKAERAIAKAARLIDTLGGSEATGTVSQTVSQARATLDQARSQYSAQKYQQAYAIANDLVESLKDLEAQSSTSQKLAVLVSLEGSVEIKKSSQHLFSGAKENDILEDGDIVKTSKSSYARVKYPNGQFQTIAPDSLVVIQALSTTPQGGSRVEVALKQGKVETTTPDTLSAKDESVIAAGDTRVRPSASTRVSVGQDEQGNTTTSVFEGATQIEAAGKTQMVNAGTTGVSVITSSQGFMGANNLMAPPAITSPRDQQVLRVDNPAKTPISFEWSGGASPSVIFQLSAKPLFSTLLTGEQRVMGNRMNVDGLPAGTYYWRLRSQGPEDKTYWSPTNRFRILQVYQKARVVRNLKLDVQATPIGDGVIIQGKTDPGVSVSVNDIEIPVSADGSFSKIELFSDKGTQPVQVRAFDEEGNEAIWRKIFQSASY